MDYLTQHNILCANKDLEVFLTGQDHQFENRKKQSVAAISGHALDLSLSQVLLDGSNVLKAISTDSSYYNKSLKLAKKAGKGITFLGGAVAGALWSGASLITGTQGEPGKDGAPGGDPSAAGGMSAAIYAGDDKQLQKELDLFQKDEVFMEKYLNQLTALEKEFQKNITFMESQCKN